MKGACTQRGVRLEKTRPHRHLPALLIVSGMLISPSVGASQVISAQLAQTEPTPQGLAFAPVSGAESAKSKTESDCVARITPELVQTVPDAPSSYPPLSKHCKLELFLRQTYSPYTFISVAYEATWAQMMAQWPQYGGGMPGWGKRLGATAADTESRRFIQGFVLSSFLHQDPRYFPSHRKKLIGRTWYAVTRVLVTRSDAGQSELNTSELIGALSTSSLQNFYYPEPYRTFGGTMNRFLGALSSDATSNILHEFTPDLKRLFHNHAPKRIQELEQKVPLPPEDRW